MINTIVRGIPVTLDGVDRTLKYLVRTYYHSGREMYVTSVWRMLEADKDFEWADPVKHAHIIKDDDKNEKMFGDGDSINTTFFWDHICTHRKRVSNRRLGELHLEVCKSIIDGKYWDGEFAFP